MDWLVSVTVSCPHCGEPHVSSIDTSQGGGVIIEDCSVCCAPMELAVECSPGEIESVQACAG